MNNGREENSPTHTHASIHITEPVQKDKKDFPRSNEKKFSGEEKTNLGDPTQRQDGARRITATAGKGHAVGFDVRSSVCQCDFTELLGMHVMGLCSALKESAVFG